MSKQPPKQPTAPLPPRTAGKEAHAGHPATGAHDDDEVLHVPRGVSRGTFIFLVSLIIFLLVIWMGGDSLFGIAGGSADRNPVTVRFETPKGRTVEWRYSDELTAQRALQDALGVDRVLAAQLGIDVSRPEPAQFKRILVLDEIAREAGIEVTNASLAKHIQASTSFGRQDAAPQEIADNFKASVRMRGLEQRNVEESLRRLLRVKRFVEMVGFAGAMPEPAKIEEQWKRDNVEFAFDYAVLPVEQLKEEARKELPDDAGLQAWFDGLADEEKTEFKSAEKRKAEAALFRDTETTPAAELLAAFPEKVPEGATPTPSDELANRYYDEVFPRRFARPSTPDQAPDVPSGFFDFAEVKDACLAEAPVYFAMQRWLEDLNARRANGETIDFAAEAQAHGLEHRAFPDALTSAEYAAAEGGGEGVATAVFSTPPDGSFYDVPVALPQGLVVVRATERSEPELPAFESIRDRVAEKWLEPKTEELAVARLKGLREGLEAFEPTLAEGETPPDAKSATKHYRAGADAFRAAVQAAGLEVATRDYLNKAGPANKDPQADDEDHRALFTLANSWRLYQLETDEVAEPGTSNDKERVYLVRLVGKRDVPIENMSPTQYDRYKRSARGMAMGAIGQELDLDYLRAQYGLWLFEDAAAAEADAAPAAQSDG